MPTKSLTRSSTDKFVGGVCGGIAAYFNIDANLVRIATIILILFGQIGWILYAALWLILPTDDGGPSGFKRLKAQFGSSKLEG